jgi:hypothetical protein
MKIAEIMLSAVDAPKDNRDAEEEIKELQSLKSVEKIPDETRKVINEAIELIRKHFSKNNL